MNEITLENYRCFRERQTVRMAPLTLLVGENSTGKTSFLALIRALTVLAYELEIPDFKEEPYDLGSFDEIAHVRDGRGGRAKTFEAGFTVRSRRKKGLTVNYSFAFEEMVTAPVPIMRHLSSGKTWINEGIGTNQRRMMKVGTNRGTWKVQSPKRIDHPLSGEVRVLPALPFLYLVDRLMGNKPYKTNISPIQDSPDFSDKDFKQLMDLTDSEFENNDLWSFASAPVRSKPRRTYDPSRPTRDPEGERIPMYLADLFSTDKRAWNKLKVKLERFGSESGLFDEISIKRFGTRASEPFQIHFRKFAGRRKGPHHNLIDVGYGVSQALPIITELLREDASDLFLLQQPEVHLHPRAQAALGSLFCQVASPERQLVVETHSDYLLDRVRMEVRDGTSGLGPEDVSILFFERTALDVKIHSLRIDKLGNIIGAPNSYRQFFMEETTRSLGL